ncbi:MAG: hypothetical protein JWL63_3469 [Rhodocyclales bacterium]|nr:hypothetical protein [Rhodocyclales bacterium]
MELERLSIELRPRNAWEALDLGVRLTMRHARAIYASWLAVTLPCALLIIGILGIAMRHPGWAVLLMWWLRPAFDRIVLHVISHAVFDAVPSVRSTLRALPRLLAPRNLFGALTWRRIGLQRSLRMPVEALEGLHGAAARQRRTLISRRVSGAATWQCIAWQTLESILTLSLFALCVLLVPNEIMEQVGWDTLMSQQDNVRVVGQLAMILYVACHLALEPMYVAGGFMLYLKRRNDLEAWDVELQLRRVAHSHAAARAGAALLSMLFAFCVVTAAAIALPGRATAAEIDPPFAGQEADASEPLVTPGDEVPQPAAKPLDPAQRRAITNAPDVLKQIMQRPEFGKDEKHSVLRWRRDDSADDKPWNFPDWLKDWLLAFSKLLHGFGKILGTLGRVGGWLLIACLALAAVYVILRYSRGWKRVARRTAPPAELAGFDIRPQSLPADVAAAARQLLHDGRTREAMSLLFRGALSVLAYRDHVPFTRGDTEGDCLDRVRQHANARFVYLARLLGKWQELAYAHRILAVADVETLCSEWPRHFSTPTEARRG